jgi:hypothetical protein
MAVGVDVQLTQGNINRVVSRLRATDKTLPAKLSNLIRRQATRVMQKQKATLAGLPVSHVSGTTGLRRKVSAGVRLRGGVGPQARLRIVTTVPDNRLGFAPRGLDTQFSGWRAPLFGDKHKWYHHEMSGPSWFMGPAEQAQPFIRQQIVKVLNMTAKDLAQSAK